MLVSSFRRENAIVSPLSTVEISSPKGEEKLEDMDAGSTVLSRKRSERQASQ